jgi:CRISPR-associated endonuclease/helicase Cas3
MIVTIVSLCEKGALKRTRRILDRYACRVGQGTWQTRITYEALHEVHIHLRKVASKNTSVACFRNEGNRGMRLMWVVGRQSRFNHDGSIAVATTRHHAPSMSVWVNMAALLARASGLAHDIGKASAHFQNKLRCQDSGSIGKDRYRHEWLSCRVLEIWRGMMDEWTHSNRQDEGVPAPRVADAWAVMLSTRTMGDLPDCLTRTQQGSRIIKTSVVSPLQSARDVLDMAVLTHHGLLAPATLSSVSDRSLLPDNAAHVRYDSESTDDQYAIAGTASSAFDEGFEKALWSAIRRMDGKAHELGQSPEDATYWRGIAVLVRLALIAADHQISSGTMPDKNRPERKDWENIVFANTKPGAAKGRRRLDQTLDWHLKSVGHEAGEWIFRLGQKNTYSGLSAAGRDRLQGQRSVDPRFAWQQQGANHIRALYHGHDERSMPRLVINTAATGTGKTLGNLMLAEAMTLSSEPFRVSIGLNLRTLTLQTGESLRRDFGLPAADIATIIGDSYTQAAHEANSQSVDRANEDEDETEYDQQWDVEGDMPPEIPEWAGRWAHTYQGCRSETRTRTLLGAPILVSTIDYLIDAGNFGRQGHHVTAALRVHGSDLILDEIDNYDPESLGAVLRLIEMAALMGRNVVVSSATLSKACSKAVISAFEAGSRMHAALNRHVFAGSQITLIDHVLAPESMTGFAAEILERIDQRFDRLTSQIMQAPACRLAYVQKIIECESAETSFVRTIYEAIRKLHVTHAWTHPSGKRISFGLVRVANIGPCVQTALALQSQPGLRVTAYHSADFKGRRLMKEIALDRLLNRKSGNANILSDPVLTEVIEQAEESELSFVVVATPVEEIGRDHDFDWAVLEPSSVASIVQAAGRVNRHRLNEVTAPNIAIINRNLRSLKGEPVCFKYPGNGKRYSQSEQDMEHLLAGAMGWLEQGLNVTAALVLGEQDAMCLLAQDDETQRKLKLDEYTSQRGVADGNASIKALAWLTKRHYADFNLRGGSVRQSRFRLAEDDYGHQYFEQYVGRRWTSREEQGWHRADESTLAIHLNQGERSWEMLSPRIFELTHVLPRAGESEKKGLEIVLDAECKILDDRFGPIKT